MPIDPVIEAEASPPEPEPPPPEPPIAPKAEPVAFAIASVEVPEPAPRKAPPQPISPPGTRHVRLPGPPPRRTSSLFWIGGAAIC